MEFVGLIAGIISIFMFLTGVNSLPELLERWKGREQSESEEAPQEHTDFHISPPLSIRQIAIFLAILIAATVTAGIGLAGSDSGGILSLLLLLAAVAAAAFRWLPIRHYVPLSIYGLVITLVIGSAGFLFGTLSRGEEVIGIIGGLAAGAGAWMTTAFICREDSARNAVR